MSKHSGIVWRFSGVLAALSLGLLAAGQEIRVKHGSFITPGDLPGEFAASLKKMGDRLTKAENAATTITGSLTDSSGTRPVHITVQAPGYLRFQDDKTSQVIAYDGAAWHKSGKGENDARIQESLMAHLPDAILLQMAGGGGFRRIGARFRTDNGKTPGYQGPYMTLYVYAPPAGQPLQQPCFVLLDEATWFINQVRVPLNSPGAARQFAITKFNKWFEQSGQWYPGEVVRLENGSQVLKLSVDGATVGGQRPPAEYKLTGSSEE
jgi:hypothetical protein